MVHQREALFMSRWVWFSLTFLVVTLALASLAPAAPVNYQESVSGDLRYFDPLMFFTFDVGKNTISGTTGDGYGTTDFDGFAFVVPNGMAVTDANMSFTLATGSPSGLIWD